MIVNIFQKRPDLFELFESAKWNLLTDNGQIEHLFQDLANEIAKSFGINESICTVKIAKLHDPTMKGEFNKTTGVLTLEYEMLINKLRQPYYDRNGTPIRNLLSNKESFETFAHELRHAIQQYFKTHPEKCLDQSWLHLMEINDEHKQNREINAYFKTISRGNISLEEFDLLTKSFFLYYLQPSERDAFLFAEDMYIAFNNLMHERYPQDETFAMCELYTNYNQIIAQASIVFNTQTPEHDIDDILRYINGEKPENRLNQEMVEAVCTTQVKTLKQKIQDILFYENCNHNEQYVSSTSLSHNPSDEFEYEYPDIGE